MLAATAASVGVKMPARMPPMMMIGAPQAGVAWRVAIISSRRLARSSRRYPRRLARMATVNIRKIPIRTPGRNPPRNSRPTEVPVMLPKITKGMLGGMMGPMVEAAPTKAAEKDRGYPAFSMAGIRMVAVPVASATADPDMPAMIMLVTTVTWPSPPRMCPTRHWAKWTSRCVIPPVFIRLPARMKKGMARRVKLVVPEYMRAGSISRTSACPSATKKITAVSPMHRAMGRPSMTNRSNTAKMAAVIMDPFSVLAGYFFRASSTNFRNVLTLSSP